MRSLAVLALTVSAALAQAQTSAAAPAAASTAGKKDLEKEWNLALPPNRTGRVLAARELPPLWGQVWMQPAPCAPASNACGSVSMR